MHAARRASESLLSGLLCEALLEVCGGRALESQRPRVHDAECQPGAHDGAAEEGGDGRVNQSATFRVGARAGRVQRKDRTGWVLIFPGIVPLEIFSSRE